MAEREDGQVQGAGVLRRWSRRKQALATSSQDFAPEQDEPAVGAQLATAEPRPAAASESATAAPTDAAEEQPLLTDDDMPDIESIGKDSDVSCFFNRGVSEPLRQRALKQLLRLPAFNITDGLNDYDEDYTTFEPLGDIVTSDMRFQAKRKAELAARQREEEEALARQQSEELEAAEPDSADPETAENASTADEQEPAVSDNAQTEAADDTAPTLIEDAPVSSSPPVTAQTEPPETRPEALLPDNIKPGDLA